ncbi:MAG: hypothetical protein L3K52_02355 [Candidatus Thiothrix sulfatifontis]|nr:MAG: hypothetical protein L3K52_02355 [Candidatus Thiothrix sulfatifontis]
MKLIPVLSAVCMVALAGCASISGGPDPIIPSNEEINILKPVFDSNQVLAYFSEQNPETRRALRDQIISARLYASDIKFSEYTQSITQELRSGAFGTDFASILLSGLASVSEPGQRTKIMAGLDTALKGGRQAFTKEILVDRTLPLLITQMGTDRKRISSQIWDNLANHDDMEYPLPLALSHLNEYYHAGTVVGALTSLGDNLSILSLRESRERSFDDSVTPTVELTDNIDLLAKEFSVKIAPDIDNIAYGVNYYTEILNKYVDLSLTDSERKERLKTIQSEIDKIAPDAVFDVNDVLFSGDNKYLKIQKSVVKNLKLD